MFPPSALNAMNEMLKLLYTVVHKKEYRMAFKKIASSFALLQSFKWLCINASSSCRRAY